MAERRISLARTVVVVGLALQFILTVLQILQSYSVEIWMERLSLRHGEAIAGTAVLVVLLALVAPAARGRRWALAAAVVVQLLLTAEMVPWLLRKFVYPEIYAQWFLNLAFTVVGATSVVFGVVALLETFGWMRPAGWRAGGGVSRQAALLLLVLSAATGAAVAGAGMIHRPLEAATLAGVPEEVVMVSMDRMAFAPTRLELPAGKRVGLLLANPGMDDHSFDLDAQGIHVRVPPGSTAMAMVEVPLSGVLPFYCGVPGHTEAGMTGVIVPS